MYKAKTLNGQKNTFNVWKQKSWGIFLLKSDLKFFWATVLFTLKKAIPVPKWNRIKYIWDPIDVFLISEQHGDNFENPQNLVDLETPEIYRMK